MRSRPRLGPVNVVLLSVYFAPVWGIDAIRALVSPFSGLEDRAHAAAAIYVGRFFDLQLDGLMRTANVLAGVKLVIAAGFLAYVIEFARALTVGREVDRETLDVVLIAAAGAIIVWALPTLAFEDAGLTRLYATQLALVAGAAVMIVVERQIEQSAHVTTAEQEPEAGRQSQTRSQGLAA
jgi:uncharacterized membrane protein